ncbi:MAG: hypothetical protein JSW48_13025 [Betaproteobacteria bacterium]|jgi:hypothetical protein|nr:MAG: hypothetical protein JSW48_13025 [Betaproteobacteria bacterium]
MTEIFKFVSTVMLGVALVACGSRAVEPSGVELPVYRIYDGSRCAAPTEFSDIVNAAATRQVRSLFLASASPEEIVMNVSELPAQQYLEAAFYLSCGEYARGELSKTGFSQQRKIYQALRLEHLSRGIQQWRESADGYELPGKICHFIHNNGEPDVRDVTRLVPIGTSIDDCAMYAIRNGGTHVLLGCSAGRWDNRWAQRPVQASPNGWANRQRSTTGTRYVPEPNCDWN